MNVTRRDLGITLAAGSLAGIGLASAAQELAPPPGYHVMDMGGLKHLKPDKPERIAMVIYPGMTPLDLVGPQQAFGYTQGCKVDLVAESMDPVVTDIGLKILPTMTFDKMTGPVDLLFVPGGGKGTIAQMSNPVVLDFLNAKGQSARWVTSVCSGSLVLGAAGLLRGYKATSHWAVREALPLLGATVATGRVVEDRNRITAGGVTAGIDFGLTLVAKLRGEDYARAVELMLEYDPHPPFNSGTPTEAREDTSRFATRFYEPLLKSARAAAETARTKWPKG